MKLTIKNNGLTLNVNKDHIESFGPHVDGGSSIIINRLQYHVAETTSEIMKLSKDDR